MQRREFLRAGIAGLSLAGLRLGDRGRRRASDGRRPPLPVRSVMRQFTSEALDKPWFYDRAAWDDYLAMLASCRFNRLHLAFGLAYDSLRNVTDSYFLFLYPFLIDLPGYAVRVRGLDDAERRRNLDTLRFVSERAVAHGLEFELGVWMHGYQLMDSPHATYVVEGLTHETHAPYCRDALAAVLRACPAISAVGLRIHGESGIAEGSYDFWSTVMDGVRRSGRRVEIDLHSKGLDDTLLDRALATGMPVNVSPKFCAEHLGLPYHQAAIRELEMPVAGRTGAGLMTLSEGSRVFTRYGYADFLRDDRRYTVRPRVFSGTQRLLAWGDPLFAGAAARAFAFCGMAGGDLMEPLTCRGRRGTGAGNRDGYVRDPFPEHRDWRKYEAWYRTWGAAMVDGGAAGGWSDAERRGGALGAALARASRILPLVTTAHLPSAACDAYWPEVYWNQPLAAVPVPDAYGDTPSPKTFVHASPLDPELFLSPDESAGELLGEHRSGRYTAVDVAQWLEELAREVDVALRREGAPASAADRATALDVALLAELGRFFAAKLRAGVLYAIHERTGDARALREAVSRYERGRDAWAALVERERGVYQADLSASDRFSERGQWADRLPAIEGDIEALRSRAAAVAAKGDPRVAIAIAEASGMPRRALFSCAHRPAAFARGAALPVSIAVTGAMPAAARLRYRRVNQAERWRTAVMQRRPGRLEGEIPGAYTDSPYPIQYYCQLEDARGLGAVYPGIGTDLAGQPYFVVRQRR